MTDSQLFLLISAIYLAGGAASGSPVLLALAAAASIASVYKRWTE